MKRIIITIVAAVFLLVGCDETIPIKDRGELLNTYFSLQDMSASQAEEIHEKMIENGYNEYGLGPYTKLPDLSQSESGFSSTAYLGYRFSFQSMVNRDVMISVNMEKLDEDAMVYVEFIDAYGSLVLTATYQDGEININEETLTTQRAQEWSEKYLDDAYEAVDRAFIELDKIIN